MRPKYQSFVPILFYLGLEYCMAAACPPEESRERIILRHYACGFLWLQDCHDYGYRVVRTEETSDLGPVTTEDNYDTRYHPYGRTINEIYNESGGLIRVESIVNGPVFRYPCDIINSQTGTEAKDIGYQLKIFSREGGTSVEPPYLLPILIPQGFDPQYGTPGQFNFKKFQMDLDSGVTNDVTGQQVPIRIDTIISNGNVTYDTTKGTLRELYDNGSSVFG